MSVAELLKKAFQNAYGIPIFMGVLYVLFPTQNSSSDAMGYATAAEIGPHHLLYDQLVAIVNWICGFSPVKTLAAMKVIDAILGAFALYIFHKTLSVLNIKSAWLYTFLCATTFGFWRFTTENEAYILPLLFAFIGMYLMAIYDASKNTKWLSFSIFCFVLSVLSHQSYVFWYAAVWLVFVFKKPISIKVHFHFILGVLLVLGVYVFAAWHNHHKLLHWMVSDATEGLVDLSPGADNFKFTAINFIRTWFQVHGNLLIFLNRNPILWLAIIVTILLILFSIYKLFKDKSFKKINKNNDVQKIALLAFIFHLFFAWFSVGNAEFMVMLPFLLVIVISSKYAVSEYSIGSFALALFIWNFCLAILPANQLNFENNETAFQKFNKRGEQLFISHNKVMLENYIALQTDTGATIPCAMTLKLGYKILEAPTENNKISIQKTMENAHESKIPVYTDCIEYPEPLSRNKLINNSDSASIWRNYHCIKIDYYYCYYGRVNIYRILPIKK